MSKVLIDRPAWTDLLCLRHTAYTLIFPKLLSKDKSTSSRYRLSPAVSSDVAEVPGHSWNLKLAILIAFLTLLTACSDATETPAGCQPSKIQKSQNEFLEIQADMKSDGEAWALLFFETAHAKEDEKIVWRITGEGDTFEAQAQIDDGTTIQPIWKEYHGGSNWHRPGQEWGTGFNFPTVGCWTITVKRGETIGTISLDVQSP